MGVLKIRENQDLYEQDPFATITTDAPWEQLPPTKPRRPELMGIVLIGLAIIGVTAFVTLWSARHSGDDQSQMPYAYLQLRVIDLDGRPVAGAAVTQKNRRLGITDSFGEWRRFMRVSLGSTMKLKVEKLVENTPLSATKDMRIPKRLPKKGDLEVMASLQLGSQIRTLTPTNKSLAVLKPIPAAEDIKPTVGNDYSAVWFEVAPPAVAPKTKASRLRARQLATLILNDLKKRARQLGVEISPTSLWKVKLQHLETAPRSDAKVAGLISVSSYYGGQQEYSLLRNYTSQSLATARGVLWSLTKHAPQQYKAYKKGGQWLVAQPRQKLWHLGKGHRLQALKGGNTVTLSQVATKGDVKLKTAPCSNSDSCFLRNASIERAFADRQVKTLRVYGVDEGTDLFVGGYKAKRVKGDLWQYSGAPKSSANVTAVQRGQIIYRGQIKAKRGKRAVLAIPNSRVAQKSSAKAKVR